jgi:hypothetical protein
MIYDDAQKLIDSIRKVCPETAEELGKLLERTKTVKNLCADTTCAKDDLFKEIEEAIKQAYEDCPKAKEDIDRLNDLFEQGQIVKCSGGIVER